MSEQAMTKTNSTGAFEKLGLNKEKGSAGVGDRNSIRTNSNIPARDKESIIKLWDTIMSGRPYHEVLEYLQHEIEESTRVVNYDYQIDCFLSDGAYALSKAVEKKIGYSKQADQAGMSGGKPPKMIDIAFADGTHTKVPFGKVMLPIFGEEAYLEMGYDGSNSILHLTGQCEQRFVNDMDDIINSTKHMLATNSIYKGKAIKYVKGREPEFINITNVDKSPLFLTKEAQFSTQPIEARIEQTQTCIDNGVDLKFGTILAGTYGTGKTLYAFKLAKKANDNDWMFLYVKDAKDTLEAMKVAQKYANNGKGIVLFVEDIDSVLSQRDAYTNEISLLLDGGESKGSPVITVFTTNHIDRIDPTFLRGKRIGSIVTLTAPDFDTAEQILTNTLTDKDGNRLFTGDLKVSAKMIADEEIVPAFISEIVERVKAHMIFSGKQFCTDEDVVVSIKSYKSQIAIAQLKAQEKTDAELLESSMIKLVSNALNTNITNEGNALKAINDTVVDISNNI